MGSGLSKKAGDSPSMAQAAVDGATCSMQYTAKLSSYEEACRLDPAVQSFDAALQRRTTHVISTLAMETQARSLSFDSLNEVTSSLVEMNQEVVKVILECKKDIWKDPKLFDLAEEYFENSLQTLDFLTALEKCLRKARDSQLMVHVALQRFEEEEEEVVEEGDSKKRYIRMLEELRSFKAEGDPFTEEFLGVFQSVYKQQLSMLEKLQLRKQRLDKKLESVKSWRKISCVIFAATFAAVLICSVVAAAVAAPPVVTALAAATSIALGSMGKWFYSLWKNYFDALKAQRGLIATMQVGSYIAIKDLDNIRVLVDQLEIQIDHLLQTADFAIMDESAVKLGVEEIKKRLGMFTKSIEDLGEQADKCSRDIRRARTVVLQRIIKHPS